MEAKYNIVLVLPYINMNLPRVYTCSPSWTPSQYHPSGSSQCTSPKHPVSCIEPGLAICFTYDNIHVSMPFSQIIPPSPSPTESKSLFYTSVSLLLSRIHALEKKMTTHSSILAWRIPGMEEPGRLPSMGSHRVGHDWSNLAAAAAAVFLLDANSVTAKILKHKMVFPRMEFLAYRKC